MPRKLILLLVGLFLLMNLGSSLFAQEAQEPLLQALSLIPDTESSRTDLIIFADVEALTQAYGTIRPTSPEEFAAMDEIETPEGDDLARLAWWRTMINFTLPPDVGETLLATGGNTSIGINYFQLDQAISYGRPPAQALILFGEFDTDAIRTAFRDKGYTHQEGMEAEVWCSDAGCEAGHETNLETRETDNPFGGQIGRRQPIVIGESYIMSSPAFALVENHITAANDSTDSLGDVPRFQAAVEAVTQQGTLVSAIIADQLLVLEMTQSGDLFMAAPDQMAVVLEAMLENYQTLPLFDLLIIADVVTETDQVVQIGLVYGDPAEAQTAAEVLPARIESYVSFRTQLPVLDMLADRRTALQEPTIYTAANGQAVLLLTFSTPRPTDLNELVAATDITLSEEDRPDVTAPGLLYRMFLNMIVQRDLGWLSTIPREELEAMLAELES